MQKILKVFKTLSDETRLRMINVLLERECSVCEVMQAMRIPQTRASRGLIALRDAGLLKARRDGLWVMYSIDEENLHKFAPNLAQVIRSALAASELAMLDRERLKTATKDGPCKLRLRSLGLE